MQGRIIDIKSPGEMRPVVLNVCASDSAGMAGLQADMRVQQAMGVHGVAAITAVTAQHSGAMLALNPLGVDVFASQLEASLVLQPKAMKVGLLATRAQLEKLCDFLEAHPMPLIYDPVVRTSAGFTCMDEALLLAVRQRLLPHCDLLTPNLDEAQVLSALPVATPQQREGAAAALQALGCRAVFLKGGHDLESHWAADYFQAEHGAAGFWLGSPRLPGLDSRGTGCSLASAIAAARALDFPLNDAVVVAKMLLNQGLRQRYGEVNRPGVLAPDSFPGEGADLPCLFPHWPQNWKVPAFPDCGPDPLGLYPIVDRADWLRRLLPLGVSTLQLRIKDLSGEALEEEIRAACVLARTGNCRLFINDHWQLAITHGAYGVHLGQEDLQQADLAAIHQAGLRLGISTHCHHEVARAHALRPSYIACGPVHPTQTKQMSWRPLGLEGLAYWCRVLKDYPVVAIGGMDRQRFAEALSCGADGVAVLSAITAAREPEQVVRALLSCQRWMYSSIQPPCYGSNEGVT